VPEHYVIYHGPGAACGIGRPATSIHFRRIVVAALALSTGCYAYVPPTNDTSLAGREVQLSLSDSGAVVLASTIGPSAEVINGRVLRENPTSLLVAVSSVRRRAGNESQWTGEPLTVPRILVNNAGERRFSPSRTALFSGAIAVGLVAVRQAFQGRGGSGGGGRVGGGTSPQ
jgi:hypothetical protein